MSKKNPPVPGQVQPVVGNNFRQLEIGEKIHDGDIFVSDGAVHPATDTGTGVMSYDHYPHYRSTANKDYVDHDLMMKELDRIEEAPDA